ncbi:MAG: hypothetical protein FRX48_07575 [Lasallia pustulata]|uniref:Uncharacterized protein n=1 Tax=Lasallia pustulata TaxID=136370 RepID=A0A5M8PHH6_9LECA|nr:MAG: hypothetical protein FRX48_07575 [Lasallia pustulata]
MVPKSFLYTSVRPARSVERNEKDVRATRVKRKPSREKAPQESSNRPSKERAATAPPTASSKPVVIPTGNRTSGLHRRKESHVPLSEAPDRRVHGHEANALPPAVAALLAVTSLPASRYAPRQRRQRKSEGHSPSRQALQSSNPDDVRPSLSSFSPQSWHVLLSPPQELDGDNISISSDTTIEATLSVRSISVDSMPSLSSDLESGTSVSAPPTPVRPTTSDRRQKGVTSPQPKNCVLDHPLLPTQDCESDDEPIAADAETLRTDIATATPVTPTRSSFKSNLTASLRVLRSAARSFSNFTAPTPERDDFLTRSILSISPRFTDERRPQASAEPPDPALRRYLNPSINSAELRVFHGHGRSRNARDEATASIQLQTYQRTSKSAKKASAPPVFLSSQYSNETPAESASSSRQREPRENSDFLRVIVLEMNMRRSGKLSDGAPGKAKMWLRPRQIERKHEGDNHSIPERWVGITA